MKPEASKEAIFDGQPRFVRAKRLARFVIDGARMAPKPMEVAREINHQKHHTAAEIERQARDFASMLRETLGDNLKTGVILHPKVAKPYDITVGAVADDTHEQHRTTALMDITSSTGHTTRLIVKDAQPTRAGSRGTTEPERQSWVSIIDPSEPGLRYDSRAYNHAEQTGFRAVALQAMDDVKTACDRGSVEVFERVV